jgi:hypothetical protein
VTASSQRSIIFDEIISRNCSCRPAVDHTCSTSSAHRYDLWAWWSLALNHQKERRRRWRQAAQAQMTRAIYTPEELLPHRIVAA